jgi:hypothetical protein
MTIAALANIGKDKCRERLGGVIKFYCRAV